MDRAGVLLDTKIFGDLDRSKVEELLPDLGERVFGRGEPVWVEGDPADRRPRPHRDHRRRVTNEGVNFRPTPGVNFRASLTDWSLATVSVASGVPAGVANSSVWVSAWVSQPTTASTTSLTAGMTSSSLQTGC